MIVTTEAPRPRRKIYYFIFSNMNILVTGVPGIGKTTLIVRILGVIKHLRAVGFYTREIRQGGIRKGFELIDLSGRKSLLSHDVLPFVYPSITVPMHFLILKFFFRMRRFFFIRVTDS